MQFVGEDDIAFCIDRKLDLESETKENSCNRLVWVHSLHHGTFEIGVTDYVCPHCNRYIPYDGVPEALFRISRKHVFARGLLDSWPSDICGTGGTFRDAFLSWASKSYSISASLQRIGMESSVTRQRGNEAFSAFLKTLQFGKEQYLYDFFSFKNCERNYNDGTRKLDAVVMDGTDLEILGKLPMFQRHKKVVPSVSRISDKQCLMPDSKLRGFLDAIYRSAKITSAGIAFAVSVKPPLWRKKHEVVSVLLDESLPYTHEACLIARIATCIFQINLTEEASNSPENGGSEEEEASRPDKIAVRHKCDEIDVRRTVIDFERCFTTGSAAGGSLRKASSVNAARLLAKELHKFSSSNHLNPSGSTCACVYCAKSLISISHKVDENLYAVSRLWCAISNSAIRSCSFNCRRLAFIVASIVTSAVETKTRHYSE